jgi:hypothetical protein
MLNRTMFANALNQQVNFTGLIAFGQSYGWNFDVEAVCLTTAGAFEMDVIMVMAGG